MTVVEERETAAAVPPPGPRSRAVNLAFIALAIGPSLTQLAFLIGRERADWPLLFTDDAYYYFGVARSLGVGDGSSFTGLIETNGYHPLWTLLLSALAAVVRDPYAFLAAVTVVQGLIWAAAVREGALIGRRLGSEAAALVGVALLGVLAVLTGQLSFSGMESGPLLLALLVAVRLALQIGEPDDSHGEVRLGMVLALVCLTRLDAVLTVVPLAAVVALRDRPMLGVLIRRSARLLGPPAVAVAAYAAFSAVVFGTPTPVSGQAKALGAPFLNLDPVGTFLQAGLVQGRHLWFGAAMLGLTAATWVAGTWRDSAVARRLMWCCGAFLAGQALLLGYLVVATSYQIWAWYLYNLALLAFCVGTLMARTLIERAPRRATVLAVVMGAAFVVLQAPVALLTGFAHTRYGLETAEFLRDELPDDAVVAMGDRAGLVGYFGERPMLQIEGLVADADWLDDLEDGTAPARMEAEGVDHYVWSGAVRGRRVTVDGRACTVLLEPRASGGPQFEVTVCDDDLIFMTGRGVDQFTVWRYRPELNG